MKNLFDVNYFAPIFMAKGFADKRNNVGEGSSAVFIAKSVILFPLESTAFA